MTNYIIIQHCYGIKIENCSLHLNSQFRMFIIAPALGRRVLWSIIIWSSNKNTVLKCSSVSVRYSRTQMFPLWFTSSVNDPVKDAIFSQAFKTKINCFVICQLECVPFICSHAAVGFNAWTFIYCITDSCTKTTISCFLNCVVDDDTIIKKKPKYRYYNSKDRW